MSGVVLFHFWRSSASYRVRIALNLAGISYDAVSVDLRKGEQRSGSHLARNPQGLVPTLEIDGLRLTQSLAIIDYLDQTRGLGLLPAEPAARAKAQALAQSIAVDVQPICNLSVAQYASARKDGVEGTVADWMRHFIRPGLLAFEALLDGFDQTPYCTGAKPGLADLCLVPQLYNARRWDADLSGLPRILDIDTACANHPAFAAAHPNEHAPN